MPDQPVLNARMEPELFRALTDRARERGISRSALLRELIRDGLEVKDEPLDVPALVVLMQRHAKAGSVRATELLLTRPWEPKRKPVEPEASPASRIDELAHRRTATA